MALSKSTRICILLGIDSAFFLLEIIVGKKFHSLALVADAFHMLNDVISLLVGLWAVKVATQSPSSNKYTYGWQRAETLGALLNGVFLVALCLSIFLDAIQRFFEPEEVSNPRLVLVVGCFGLMSNILGLLLFHEHGHSHGPQEEPNSLSAAEIGQSDTPAKVIDEHTEEVSDESGNIASVLPQVHIGANSELLKSTSPTATTKHLKTSFTNSDADDSTVHSGLPTPTSPTARRKNSIQNSRRKGSRYSVDEISFYPSSFRKGFIAASHDLEQRRSEDAMLDENAESSTLEPDESRTPSENDPLLPRSTKSKTSSSLHTPKRSTRDVHQDSDSVHKGHRHCPTKDGSAGGGHSHGHSHGDLNMRGVFLHVMGDALGNIGVIASALIIWLTTFPQRFYFDPIISILITCIILKTAIPLCLAASRILLQAVPDHISVDDIKADIEDLPGILSCHHLHVWQLSETKLIASLHIQVEFDFKEEGSARYMKLAKSVRRCLHEYGIHSSTIQPEFCLDEGHKHTLSGATTDDEENDGGWGSNKGSKKGSRAASLHSQPDGCLLDCTDACAQTKMCCPKTSATPDNERGS